MTWDDAFLAAISGVCGDPNMWSAVGAVEFAGCVADNAVDYAENRSEELDRAVAYALGEAKRICKENAYG